MRFNNEKAYINYETLMSEVSLESREYIKGLIYDTEEEIEHLIDEEGLPQSFDDEIADFVGSRIILDYQGRRYEIVIVGYIQDLETIIEILELEEVGKLVTEFSLN